MKSLSLAWLLYARSKDREALKQKAAKKILEPDIIAIRVDTNAEGTLWELTYQQAGHFTRNHE